MAEQEWNTKAFDQKWSNFHLAFINLKDANIRLCNEHAKESRVSFIVTQCELSLQDPLHNHFEAQEHTCAFALREHESARQTCKTSGKMQLYLGLSFL